MRQAACNEYGLGLGLVVGFKSNDIEDRKERVESGLFCCEKYAVKEKCSGNIS